MLVITGAAGFIGSNLLAKLEAAGSVSIAACDILDSDSKQNNVAKRDAVTWINPADVLNYLAAHSSDIEALIHLGAETATTATDRDAVFAVNVDLSKALWEWATQTRTPFLYASSASVYGDGVLGFDDDPSPEAMGKLKPLNIYGESKLAFDLFVAEQVAASAATPPQWAGLRFFNVFGPNELHKGTQASVVSQMHPIVAQGEPYPLFRSHRADVADGEQRRDFVFVDDCVGVIQWLLTHPGVSGLFNVGSGQARTFLDLAKAVHRASGRDYHPSWRDTPESLKEHYQYFTQAELTRLRRAGYTDPFTSLEDGVTITIKEFLSQPDPFR
ncbi:MAG: ADP-glyceromanno-heptose 6-epimerase [Rhodospirillaceae bacterium]|nr:ADP-glyceromanno-heptose 6-epimerase [Rhodospirillaceae bacterium]MBT5241143.1 ADP-glyceromanno-heptose 6-epimerase [Rhodospirillaceae bacterium]MBT5565655.1 ADP-glyceromanno-heptose 6-epimerase [Rhodospirillaceae bacterium]MBT6090861.1 ADP-glyceromanno-heptose 6-epimerase [Rhodospirillaceae bacterium]